MCRTGQGEARGRSAVATRSHRVRDRPDISFAFEPVCLYLKNVKQKFAESGIVKTEHSIMLVNLVSYCG